MTLLPVVGRELRVASRRPWNYWGRATAAAAAVIVCGWIMILEPGSNMTHLGAELFAVTTFLSFVFALLAGVVYCADALAVERREGTLGLLFLTDLRGHDVLLGKLAACSLGCIFQLGAALPVIAMSMLLGSVGVNEYLRMILVLGSTLFLSLSVGMFASTLSADGKRAAVLAVGLLVAVCGLIPALGGLGVWVGHKLGHDDNHLGLLWQSTCSWETPVPLYWRAFDDGFKGSERQFWQGIAFVWGVALVSLLWGSLRLPRLWQEKGLSPRRRGPTAWLEDWRWPTAGHRVGFRTRLLETSPLVWLAGRHWSRGVSVWVFLGGVAMLFLLIGSQVGSDWFELPTFLTVSILVHLVFKLWISAEAPRQFMDDRRSGAMELLVSTPLTVSNLVQGRMQAVRRQFEGPALLVLATDVVFLFAGLHKSGGDSKEWVAVWVGRMLLFVVDGYALAWTGVWVGMRTRGARSTLPVFFRVIVLPWLLILVLSTIAALLANSSNATFNGMGLTGAVVLWCCIGGVTDVFWITFCQQDLMRGFREYARLRPGEKKLRAKAA